MPVKTIAMPRSLAAAIDFLVAHAAAGLDHRDGAVVGDDVEAVAERKERVGRDHRTRER